MRSLEIGCCHIYIPKFDSYTDSEILEYIAEFHDDNIFAIAQLLRHGHTVSEIAEITKITPYFLHSFKKITDMEAKLKSNKLNSNLLADAKEMGFSDKYIARLWDVSENDVYAMRRAKKLFPAFRWLTLLTSEHTRLTSIPPIKEKMILYSPTAKR